MTDDCKMIDPTAFGLFFVALVSLPLALAGFFNFAGYANCIMLSVGKLLMACGLFIVIASILSYRAGSNFGFVVFGLVALGVFYAGYDGGDLFINLTLAMIYLMCFIWSIRANTLKILSYILLVTTFVFLANGLVVDTGASFAWLLLGISGMLNFVLTFYLAFALADGKVPCF